MERAALLTLAFTLASAAAAAAESDISANSDRGYCGRFVKNPSYDGEYVLRIALLLPVNPNPAEKMSWHNGLRQVLPAVRLAADGWQIGDEEEEPPVPQLKHILPGWKVEVVSADSDCSSTYGPLRAVELNCRAGKDYSPRRERRAERVLRGHKRANICPPVAATPQSLDEWSRRKTPFEQSPHRCNAALFHFSPFCLSPLFQTPPSIALSLQKELFG